MTTDAPRKRVTKSAEQRRADILDAAVRVFATKGINRATVSDVTEAAGVAKGTFYLYFESKEHLLGALKERFVDEMVGAAARIAAQRPHKDWWAMLDTVVETMIDVTLRNRDMIQVISQEGNTPNTSSIFAECERRLDTIFASGIEAGMEAGAFHATDPAMTASLLHHAVEGLVRRAILYEGHLDRDRMVAAAKEICRRALRA